MLCNTDRQTLLNLARESIQSGLTHGQPLAVKKQTYSTELQQPRASFVTLHKHGELRGCIGSLEAHQALVDDIASNAFNAAFRDPRFPPLQANEFDQLHIHIEILTPPEPIQFSSEQELLDQLQLGKDGLLLSEGLHRGTFLPTVWESLPRPEQFLFHLKNKAGLPGDYWSDNIKVQRYHTESFEEEPAS
ncbi:MAG: AmmeMemoRadiSam system protein A [Sulfuriflexus sp.]|nr:AmmeMemoRadiSam system protein A [Sulfuriflexus sp.]